MEKRARREPELPAVVLSTAATVRPAALPGYREVLRHHRWGAGLVFVVLFAVTLVATLVPMPVYRATALVDVVFGFPGLGLAVVRYVDLPGYRPLAEGSLVFATLVALGVHLVGNLVGSGPLPVSTLGRIRCRRRRSSLRACWRGPRPACAGSSASRCWRTRALPPPAPTP